MVNWNNVYDYALFGAFFLIIVFLISVLLGDPLGLVPDSSFVEEWECSGWAVVDKGFREGETIYWSYMTKADLTSNLNYRSCRQEDGNFLVSRQPITEIVYCITADSNEFTYKHECVEWMNVRKLRELE